jgi:hypothetical protein
MLVFLAGIKISPQRGQHNTIFDLETEPQNYVSLEKDQTTQ